MRERDYNKTKKCKQKPPSLAQAKRVGTPDQYRIRWHQGCKRRRQSLDSRHQDRT